MTKLEVKKLNIDTDIDVEPFATTARRVPQDWIDYNGHMNVAYYSMAFDKGLDEVLEKVLGFGKTYTEITRMGPYVLQNNLHYLGELLQAASFSIKVQIIDHDAKRMHLFLLMINDAGEVCATSEQLIMNVDLTKRRAASYPEEILEKLEKWRFAQRDWPRPSQVGAALGIRRKG